MAFLKHSGGIVQAVSELGFDSVKYFEATASGVATTLDIFPPARRLSISNRDESTSIWINITGTGNFDWHTTDTLLEITSVTCLYEAAIIPPRLLMLLSPPRFPMGATSGSGATTTAIQIGVSGAFSVCTERG